LHAAAPSASPRNSTEVRVFRHVIPAHRLFLWLAPLLYAAFALLTPPFQTPDEQQHLFRAWQLSELHLIGERSGNAAGGLLPAGLGQAALPEIGTLEAHASRKVVRRPFASVFQSNTSPDAGGPRRFFDFRGSVFYSPAGYVPQVFAIWLGRPAGLSVENIIRLGRLLNAALTIGLMFWAIRLTPLGARLFMWVGLLPMSACAAASFGQDGLVIGDACLLTAIGLRAAVAVRWNRTNILVAAALAIGLTLSKIFYLPLGLIGALPFGRDRLLWRRPVVPLLICIVAAVLTGLWLHAISDIIVPPRTDIPPPGPRLAAWFQHPETLFMLLEHTFVSNGIYIVGTLFKFGWLNVGPDRTSEFLSIVALLLALLAGDSRSGQLDWKVRLWLLLLAASAVVLISAAIYLYSRPATDGWVEGFQGRYLIPVAPALLVAVLPRRAQSPAYIAAVPLLMIAANIVALRTIFLAFYV
jgi:uncharacterized membrane protein